MSLTETPSAANSEPPSSRSNVFQSAWPWILCVVGLDYMSTLGYVPSIAFDTAGRLAPLVMGVLAFLTIFGALPIYWYVSGRSPSGGGAMALFEKLIPGWVGKLLILLTLGFATTDLIFTRTFSSADAAEHLLHGPNPAWQGVVRNLEQWVEEKKDHLPDWVSKPVDGLSNKQMVVTIVLLMAGTIIGVVFRHGFRKRFLQLAVLTTVLYLLLNLFVIGSGISYLLDHPFLIDQWWQGISAGDWQSRIISADGPVSEGEIAMASLELFPRVALGLSGFEIAMLLMPLVKGSPKDTIENPRGRIRNTRKMLVIAAFTMPLYLMASTFVTTLLIPPEAFRTAGEASNRALAYLAHGGPLLGMPAGETMHPLCGMNFGTIYDVSTILILCLAGVSIGLCLADLVPPYLHRLGMELDWLHKLGLLIYILTFMKIGVTIYYGASVEAQRSAYSTSVLAVFTSAAFVCTLDVWQRRPERRWWARISYPFSTLFVIFAVSTIHTIRMEPDGLFLTLWFIGFILIISILTRVYKATELRCKSFEFVDDLSRHEFEKLKIMNFPILIPHRPGHHTLVRRDLEIRKKHRISGHIPLVFVIVELGDPSEFYMSPRMEVRHEEGRVVIHVTRSASVAHVLAAIAIDLSRVGVAPEIHFGWSEENPLTANLHFVLFGQGNIPWMVHTLLQKSDLPESQKPRVLVG